MKKGRSEGSILPVQTLSPVITPFAAASGNSISIMNAHKAAQIAGSLFIVSKYVFRHRFIRTRRDTNERKK